MNGRNYIEAIKFMKTHKDFSIGVHLNLTGGKPVTNDLKKISSLIQKDGSFLNYRQFRKKCLRFNIPYSQIYTELENQILKFLDYSMRPTHIDSHYHVHTLPLVALAVTKLARRYRISKIRPSLNYFKEIKINHQDYFFWLLKLVYKKMINCYFKQHFIMPDYFCSGDLRQILNNAWLLKSLSIETYVLSCHPTFGNIGSSEVDILTDRNLVHKLNNLDIRLVSFNEL